MGQKKNKACEYTAYQYVIDMVVDCLDHQYYLDSERTYKEDKKVEKYLRQLLWDLQIKQALIYDGGTLF